MATSKLNLIWANRPGTSLAVAEFWIGRDQLWFTIFVDDNDRDFKIELLPPLGEASTFLLDFAEAESLIEEAKRNLLAMSAAAVQQAKPHARSYP
ncbi:MAG: hypothetical protein K8T89_21485 [Planctomycetes bacterium]|nr:hypothetical protein [Planctomycetota bacterium]